MGLDAKNERLCLNMQADTKNKDKYLAELLVGNAQEFQHWVYAALAEALEKNAEIIPDELMGEALSGFRRAAEIYRPETHADFTEYAQAWVKARVRAYVRKAERGDLPKTMPSHISPAMVVYLVIVPPPFVVLSLPLPLVDFVQQLFVVAA